MLLHFNSRHKSQGGHITMERYYVVDNTENRTITFDNKIELLKWLKRTALTIKENNINFDNINFNGKDTITYREITSGLFGDVVRLETRLRRYTIYNEQNKIIDIRNWASEIIDTDTSYNNWYKHRRTENKVVGERYYIYSWRADNIYKFRRGNVPGISKCKWHRGSCYRRIKYIRVCKLNEQYPGTIRHKAKFDSKCMWYDDMPYRKTIKSWKNQTKCKYQWEKNLRKAG